MKVSYQLTREDYEEYLRAAWRRLYSMTGEHRTAFAWNLGIYIPFGVALMGFYGFVAGNLGLNLIQLYIAVGALLSYFIFALLGRWARKKRYAKSAVLDEGWFLAPSTLTITPEGIVTRCTHQKFEIAWVGILAMQHTKNLILLFFDGMGAIVIPKRAFSKEELGDLMSVVRSRVGADSPTMSPSHGDEPRGCV